MEHTDTLLEGALRAIRNGASACLVGIACGALLVIGLQNFPIGTGLLRDIYWAQLFLAAGAILLGAGWLVRAGLQLAGNEARALARLIEMLFPNLLKGHPATECAALLIGRGLAVLAVMGLAAGILWRASQHHVSGALGFGNPGGWFAIVCAAGGLIMGGVPLLSGLIFRRVVARRNRR